jgi:ABC-type oligopeptide transport system substrate-binding subunit/DNA-binding SARP family transcriptional activator
MLGPPSITWTGQPVTISRRQARALVYRLAVRLEVMPREQLCFLFWSDVPESTARRRLSRLLAHLRQALPAPGLLLSERDFVWLDPDRVWSDTATFERLCAELDDGSLECLQRAVHLCRGPFLAGFSMPDALEVEDWALSEQRAFELLYLKALAGLMEAHAERGSYGEAIPLAQRYLNIDELAESVHRRLIEIFAAAGDRSAALRQYERCTTILARELSVHPAPETQAAYELARRNEIQPTPPATTIPAQAPILAAGTPLVGRWEALQRLWQAHAGVQQRQGRVVLLCGEAGIGKSRLLGEFGAQLRSAGVLLTGAGYASSQTTPFLPLVEALRSHLRARQAPLQVEPVWLGEASLLFPELRTKVPGLPQPVSASIAEGRSRLFEALRQLLLGLASDGNPIVLCLDDLHRTDQVTLNWLAYLGRHLRNRPILVVGTYRTEEVGAVRSLRHELHEADVLEEVLLEPLTEEEALPLVRSLMAETPANQALVRRLCSATGGNPFFLIETVRLLLETGQPREGGVDGNRLPLPGSVHETLRRRVARLSAKAQQSLAAGAILGMIIDFHLVQRMTGQGSLEIADGLDELVRRNLLVVGEEGYRFRHEMIQAAVYQDLGLSRRQVLHRRAAQALENQLSDQDVPGDEVERVGYLAQLGHHYAEAGMAEEAIKFLVQAGDQTRLLYGHEEAIAHYRRALKFLRASKDHHRAARTLMKLGLSYLNALDFARARETYDEAFAEWQRASRMPYSTTFSASQAAATLRLPWSDCCGVDPIMFNDMLSSVVCSAMFRGLVELTPELDVVPDLASSWEVQDGGCTYIFHLRDDARWSDGQPVTAHDFQYAWKRLLSPALVAPMASELYVVRGARAYHQGEVADADRVGVQARDEHTLVVTLEQPTGYLPYLISMLHTCAVPRHVVEAHPRSWAEAGKIAVSGPFQPEIWHQGNVIGLVRNSSYNDSYSGNVQRVELHVETDPSTLLKMYEANDLDILELRRLGSLDMADSARQTHASEYLSLPWWNIGYLVLDTERTPFDDPQVRRAFALAIDKEKLADVILRGYLFPAEGGFVPPGMPGHSAGIGLAYDPEEARRLLARAGYPGGRGFPPVVALGISANLGLKVREELRSQWLQILGVDIAWESYALKHADRQQQLPCDLYFGFYMADFPDPDNLLRLEKYLVCRWQNETYDMLLAQTRRVLNPQERLALYRQAEGILVEEAVFIPLTYGRLHLLVKPWVKRLPVSPLWRWFWKDIVIEEH